MNLCGLHKDLVEFLWRGTKVSKRNITNRNKRNKSRKKKIILDADNIAFRYEPSRKGPTFKIPVSEVTSITYGLNLKPKDLQSKVPATNQFVVDFTRDGQKVRLHFTTRSEQEAKDWAEGLQYLKTYSEHVAVANLIRPSWLKDIFKEFDHDNNGALTLPEIHNILRYISISLDEDIITKCFEKFNENDMDRLPSKIFSTFFHELMKFNDIKNIFQRFLEDDNNNWSADSYRRFMEDVQKVDEKDKDYTAYQDIISRFTSAPDPTRLNFIGFLEYILSSENDVIIPEHSNVFQDMNQPLSHYFINSSHNTYLSGDQLRGSSTVQAYINALQNGCKCIELDCWDGDNEEPVIYHGHTLTSKILFKDVIEAVNQHFESDSYPLILSLENHCSISQQKVMARHLKDILKDKLYQEEIDPNMELLPSPDYFKGKILIKGKKLAKKNLLYDQVDGSTNDFIEEENGYISEEDEAEESIDMLLSDNDILIKMDFDPSELSTDKQEDKSDEGDGQRKLTDSLKTEKRNSAVGTKDKKKKKLKLSLDLSNLIKYIQAVHFKGFSTALQGQSCFQMSSLGEHKFQSLARSHGADFVEYNKKFLTRTYPAGSRFDSSNYDPSNAWVAGCQIVALNFQTVGEMMDLNNGLFQVNGKSGYVLKPRYLREKNFIFDPEQERPYDFIPRKSVKITIISGHLLPRKLSHTDIIDPYVTFDVYGIAQDKQKNKFKTKKVSNNGFNPVWNETFEFNLYAPELAILRFVVMDQDLGKDDFVAQSSIPFSSVRPGLRRVSLTKRHGESVHEPCLLVNLQIH